MQEETKLQRDIREALEEEFPNSFWFKSHGSLFQKVGLPDLIGCVCGLYMGLEVKTNRKNSKTSDVQDEVRKDIQLSGGLGCTVRSPEQAIRKVYRHLRKYYGTAIKEQIEQLSNKRGEVRLQREKSGSVHATWDWENHNIFNGSRKSK